MKYKIKYNYNTGDSFRNEDGLEGVLELEWSNLEIAEKNIERIQEHYEQYKSLESYRPKVSRQELLQNNSNKDWFVKKIIYIVFNNKKKDLEDYYAIDINRIEECKAKGLDVGEIIDISAAQNQIILYTDENKPFQFWAPWCGYFESLNNAEVISSFKKYEV